MRRPAPAWLAALVVGAPAGLAISLLDLPFWWLAPAALAGSALAVVLMLPGQMLRAVGIEQRGAALPCPRCETRPRTDTGWCAVCTTELRAAGPPAAASVHTYLRAADTDDWAALRTVFAPQVTLVTPTGRRGELEGAAFVDSMRRQSRFMRKGENETLGLHADPGDVAAAWLIARSRARWRFGGGGFDLTTVTRLRLDHDERIAEYQVWPPVA